VRHFLVMAAPTARRLILLLAALTALVLTAIAGVALAPAAHAAGAQNRVGAFIPRTQSLTRPAALESSCSRPGLSTSTAGIAAGFCVATEEEAASASTELQTFYPPNNGFSGAADTKYLQVGERIDRYGGSGYSRFFSPEGTAEADRALPPGTAGQSLNSYVVAKPFPVESGPAASWFDSFGGGTQYRTPVPLGTLLQRGILEEAP
jgi:hypothetical protein